MSVTRYARFLGYKEEDGSLGKSQPYEIGSTLQVGVSDDSEFPWRDQGEMGLLRTNELEFLPEGKVDLNDYL